MYDLLVRDGTVVTAAHTEELDVAVSGEKIVAIGEPGGLEPRAKKVIDAAGKVVIPGGVDPHVHYGLNFERIVFAEPQEYSWAAAWGGTTTIIDFALQSAEQPLHEAVAEKKDEASGRMAVDYGLHAMLTGTPTFDVIEEIGDVIRGGHPNRQDAHDVPVDDGRRAPVGRDVGGCRARRPLDRPCRGRRDRELAHGEVRPRGKDAWRVRLRDAGAARRGGGDPTVSAACRAERLAAVRLSHGCGQRHPSAGGSSGLETFRCTARP